MPLKKLNYIKFRNIILLNSTYLIDTLGVEFTT